MAYAVGLDVGTTYASAAVARNGTTEVVTLEHRSTVVPSAVFVTDTGEVLVGPAAIRRGAVEPDRLAREFKRRIGDSVPLILGGAPWSAESLTARLLRWLVDEVVSQNGEPPDRIVVTHPANWGGFKQERMAEVLTLADLPVPGAGLVVTATEPGAAATWYAAEERVPPGQVIAVYDLGGGTFDAAVLRKDGNGFQVLGTPEGVERLGGIDVDEAVVGHVRTVLSGQLDELDPDDPATVLGLARLRVDCVEAKEALSSDTQVTIPVALPELHTGVRLTRAELEEMSRPLLEGSITALSLAITSAGLTAQDVDRVLLVGGGSRMPLVSRLVSEAFGRPFFVDAHPKHAVCLGAALLAAGGAQIAAAAADGGQLGAPGPAPGAGVATPPPVPAPMPPWMPAPVLATPGVPPPSPGRGRPGRTAVSLMAGAAVVLLVVLGVLLLQRVGDGDPGGQTELGGSTTTPKTPASTDDPEAAPVRITASRDEPAGGQLAVAADGVWVADIDNGPLRRYRRSLHGEPEELEVVSGGRVSALDVASNRLWVVTVRPLGDDLAPAETELLWFDASTRELEGRAPIGDTGGSALVRAEGDVAWVLTGAPDGSGGPVLYRADAREGEAVEMLSLGAEYVHQDLSVTEERVWLAVNDAAGGQAAEPGRILAVDAAGGDRVTGEDIVMEAGPVGPIAAGPDGLWVVDWRSRADGGDSILHLDPAGEPQAEIPVTVSAMAVEQGWVWAWRAGSESGEGDEEALVLIDRGSGEIVDELPMEGDMVGLPWLAAAGSDLWFTHRGQLHAVGR